MLRFWTAARPPPTAPVFDRRLHPEDIQEKIISEGPKAIAQAAKEQRLTKKPKAIAGVTPELSLVPDSNATAGAVVEVQTSSRTLIEQLSGLTLNPLDAAEVIDTTSAIVLLMDSKLAGELAPTAMNKFIAAVRELKFGVFLTTDLKKKLDPSGFAQSTKQKLRKKTSENRDSLAAIETEAPAG